MSNLLGRDHELLVCNRRQWDAYKTSITHYESLDHRSRRCGKTLALSHKVCFFNLLQFGEGSLKGLVIYRTPSENQLKGLRQWIRKHPFYVKWDSKEHEITLFGAESTPINANAITETTTTGLECSVLCFDETQGIKKHTIQFIQYGECMAFLAKGAANTKRLMHSSSGRVNTPFHDAYLLLCARDPSAIVTMPYTQCPWITEEHVQRERDRNFMIPYFVEEQYECQWVLVTGHFFDQTKLHIVGFQGCADLPAQQHLEPNCAGVDFNGDVPGHVLSLCYYNGENLIVVFKEIIFQHIGDLAQWIRDHPHIPVEVEGGQPRNGRVSGGAYNAGFADHLQEYGLPVAYEDWSEARVKQYRLAQLQKCEIYTYPHCKWFIKNYKEATYDEKGNVDGRPKLKKTDDQHGLDATIHGIGSASDIDIINPTAVEELEMRSFGATMRSLGGIYENEYQL